MDQSIVIPPVDSMLIRLAIGQKGAIGFDQRAMEAGFDFSPVFKATQARVQALLELIQEPAFSLWKKTETGRPVDDEVIELAARFPLSGTHFDTDNFVSHLLRSDLQK